MWRIRDASFADEIRATMFAQSLVCQSLGRLCEHLSTDQLRRFTSASVDAGRIASALQLIENHLDRRLGNARLADAAHLSKSSFIRQFATTMGQTPARYSTERRIAAAAELLAHSDSSIESIAERFGFTNRFYLSRVFTRLMGVPPAQYRKARSL